MPSISLPIYSKKLNKGTKQLSCQASKLLLRREVWEVWEVWGVWGDKGKGLQFALLSSNNTI
jgi:hypothetical protein